MGAVPLKAAKRSRVGKRAMSPVTPTTVAATTGPTPKMSMVVVPDAATTCSSRFFDSASWPSTRRRSSSSSSASSTRAAATALSGSTPASNQAALLGVDLVGDAAGDEVAQHRVQPAGDLGAGARQVPVTSRPQLHHRGVILDADLASATATAARRWRPTARRGGRSCWSTRWPAAAPAPPASAARPGPARRRRPAAGRAGSRGRWRSRSPRCARGNCSAHCSSRSSCLGPDRTRSSARLRSLVVDRHRRVRSLVRVDADHHRHRCSFVVERVEDRGRHV